MIRYQESSVFRVVTQYLTTRVAGNETNVDIELEACKERLLLIPRVIKKVNVALLALNPLVECLQSKSLSHSYVALERLLAKLNNRYKEIEEIVKHLKILDNLIKVEDLEGAVRGYEAILSLVDHIAKAPIETYWRSQNLTPIEAYFNDELRSPLVTKAIRAWDSIELTEDLEFYPHEWGTVKDFKDYLEEGGSPP